MTDPFDDLGDEDDRDGDPFAELDDADAPTAADGPDGDSLERTDDAAAPGVPDPADGGPETDTTDRADAGPVPGARADVTGDPFGDVDVSRDDPFEAADSPFEQVDVTGVDPDDVWERFTADAAAESGVDPPDQDVVVSKHEFCEGCPHFTTPPDAECIHGGTSILEFVGPDDVRVENCPVVRERRELGEVHD